MRWPLRYQILVPFAAVLLVAIVAVSVLSAVLAAQRAQRQIEEQLQGIAATLADSTFPLTEVVLRQMHGLSGADFVFVDSTGQVVAANRALDPPAEESPLVTDDWQELRLGPPATIGNERFFQMVLAIQGRGLQGPGRLHIFYPERFWQEARSEAALPPLVVGAIALAATALLAVLIAGRLTQPILELRRQVHRIAEADFSPMPLPTRNDELRDLAAAVNRLAEQLTEMDRAIRRGERLALLGQLAGGLAHHLRNNVTGARMAVQLHARECEADRESLDVALRQLTLTEENLKQFLAAPQPNGETAAAPRKTPCRMGEIVDEVVRLLGPSLRHRRIELSITSSSKNHAADSTNNGPPLTTDNGQRTTDQLLADPDQLRQMLVNLVLNAADAAGPGGEVKIATSMVPGKIALRVIDNGPGPPPEMAGRMFEPLATSKPEGVGLGLAVAQQIATTHGGRLEFTCTDGETCFEVCLPCANNGLDVGMRVRGSGVCAKPAIDSPGDAENDER